MYCKGRLPRQFEQDVLYGLVGLFVRKNAPFDYNEEKKMYNIYVSKVEFSFYELCSYMRIPYTPYYIEKCREAIRIMKQTQYFSYDAGVLYDKKNSKYLISGETGVSLINDYRFMKTKKSDNTSEFEEIDHNWIEFNTLILDNLRYEYMKFLNNDLFFGVLPSGIERGIYTYLEANRYDDRNKVLLYIKRSYEVLRVGVPVDFDFTYILKRKMTKPLNHLKEIGYLVDWAYGDDLKINGIKENCIYFCFGITIDELKKMLERKKANQLQFNLDSISKVENDFSKETYLCLPQKSLKDELIDKGFDEVKAKQISNQYDKWDIIKYLIWINKQLLEGKTITNIAGLLRFALEKQISIDSGYSEIIEFIEEQKNSENKKKEEESSTLDEKYEKYIKSAIKDFKTNEKDVYDLFHNTLLNDLLSTAENRIRQIKSGGGDISKIEDFLVKKEKSEWFKEMFVKEITLYKGLKTFEQFKRDFI